MKPRNGKVARLPGHIRQQLNQRLLDNEPYASILQWLNGLPEVQAVMTAQFSGCPISQQNLSEWKLGGFREWFARSTAASGPADGLNPTQREQSRHIARQAFYDCFIAFLRGYASEILAGRDGQAAVKPNGLTRKGKLSLN